jgi:hypothetical protein
MGVPHTTSLPGMGKGQLEKAQEREKREPTHSTTANFSPCVRLSLDRSVGSCLGCPVEPEPVEGAAANSSSRRCIDRFCWAGRFEFLTRVTVRGPL